MFSWVHLNILWMIRGQLEPFSDPSSALLCIPALAPLAERLMVSCIYKLLPQTLSFKAMQIVHITGQGTRVSWKKTFPWLGVRRWFGDDSSAYICCALYSYSYCHYISTTADGQALDPGGWAPQR